MSDYCACANDKKEYAHYLSVVMPAYNEGKHIKDNLLKTSEIIGKFVKDYEIIAINDGSRDETNEEMCKAAQADSHIRILTYDTNHGKGFAITKGVCASDARYIAFLDSDLELNPSMLSYFLKAVIEFDADIAIGSKLHKQSKIEYPFIRKFISYGYYLLLKLLFKLKIKDTQTGIKLFKSEVITPICMNVRTSGFAYDIEILATASKLGYKIIELPIRLEYSRTKGNRSTINPIRIFRIFRDTIRIKRNIDKL